MNQRTKRDPYGLVGTVLSDRFRLEELVGIGGMGVVYRATHTVVQRTVAVKVLKPDLSYDTDITNYFIEEAVKTATLNHPFITQIYDANTTDDGLSFIAMEWLSGHTLEVLLRDGIALPIEKSNQILKHICDAMSYAHSKGIVHRDLKPSNLMLLNNHNDEEIVKVMDFGIAKALHHYQDRVTRVVGTPYYASPEQLISEAIIDHRSDIYTIGILIFQMLTGTLPFDADSIASIIQQKQLSPPPSILGINEDIGIPIDQVIQCCLAKDPKDRFESTEELYLSFQAAIKQTTVKRRRLEQIAAPVPPRRQRMEETKTFDLPKSKQTGTSRDFHISTLEKENPPTGFFDNSYFFNTRFFAGEKIRYIKVEETLRFYRDSLKREYDSLLRQVNTAYYLWLACVLFGFIVFATGLVMLLLNKVAAGVFTTVSGSTVYFIQRIFHQREDHYRELATTKHRHLEFGNEWLLIIQSIDAIENSAEKMKQQTRLVEVLTDKLKSAKSSETV